MNSLQTTLKDIEKLSNKSVNVVKVAMYYAFIPTIVYLGARTINW